MVTQTDWTDAELKTAVQAYLWMLGQELSGNTYSKSKTNQGLRDGELASRTKASIEYRMQNISSALDELCLPRIKGYLPAKNIGNNVKDRIKGMLTQLGHVDAAQYIPTSNLDELDDKVSRLRRRAMTGTPRGVDVPRAVTTTSQTFVRDPLVKAYILSQADGKCDGCGQSAPFKTVAGDPYLEVHHVLPLAQGGADTIANAVALCPNCHRRAHFSADRDEFVESFKGALPRTRL